MKRQFLLAFGCLLLLSGWMSAFLQHRFLLQSDFIYLLPALLLGVGLGLVLKLLGGKRAAIVVALTAFASVLAVNQLYPNKGISLSAFQGLPKPPAPAGKAVDLLLPEGQAGHFFAEQTLFTDADVSVKVFATLPGGPRMLSFDKRGHLFVTIPELGAIYQLQDLNQDGYAEEKLLYHAGLDRPSGLLWREDLLYVAETDRLLALRDNNNDEQADEVKVLLDNLPDDGGHWTRSLAMMDDSSLFLSVGSRCNACEETDPRRATVLRVDLTTNVAGIFARGLRNTVGLTVSPDGKSLWGSDNGRDRLGDDLPPDEINRLISGGDYGWPSCYGARISDPDLDHQNRCAATIPPEVELQAHSAPLGIAFGNRLKAPAKYQDSLYVAYHGSWNRSVPTGYKLVRIPFTDNQPAGQAIDFLTGWLAENGAWGRPVAPLVGPDGNLYLSDDRADAIYRISFNLPES